MTSSPLLRADRLGAHLRVFVVLVAEASSSGSGIRCARRFVGLANSPSAGARVAADTGGVHTPTMTLKNAALLALIGTVLMTVLLVWNFVFNLLNLLQGLVPAVMLFSSFIYAFGCFSVMVFFFVFHRTQS
jgi:L-asparagine transporter-like permease